MKTPHPVASSSKVLSFSPSREEMKRIFLEFTRSEEVREDFPWLRVEEARTSQHATNPGYSYLELFASRGRVWRGKQSFAQAFENQGRFVIVLCDRRRDDDARSIARLFRARRGEIKVLVVPFEPTVFRPNTSPCWPFPGVAWRIEEPAGPSDPWPRPAA